VRARLQHDWLDLSGVVSVMRQDDREEFGHIMASLLKDSPMDFGGACDVSLCASLVEDVECRQLITDSRGYLLVTSNVYNLFNAEATAVSWLIENVGTCISNTTNNVNLFLGRRNLPTCAATTTNYAEATNHIASAVSDNGADIDNGKTNAGDAENDAHTDANGASGACTATTQSNVSAVPAVAQPTLRPVTYYNRPTYAI
jgi:hypothetical protein